MKLIQPSFAAGELSPSLWARVDLAKFHVGARTLRNMLVHPHGGASNRAGTLYVGTVPAKARLIPFEFNTAQTYCLVFTGLEMRIIKDGGFVLYPVGHPSAGQVVVIVSPFAQADLERLTFTQSSDTLFLAHPSYTPYKLTRTDHHLWTFGTLAFDPAIAVPTALTAMPNAGSYQSAVYKVCGVNASNEEGDFSTFSTVAVANPWAGIVALSWPGAAGAIYYNVYRNLAGGGWSLRANVFANSWVDSNGVPLVTAPAGTAAIDAPASLTAVFAPPAATGNTYRYKVAAITESGESDPSSEATGASSNPWASGERVHLSWVASAGAKAYAVYKNSRGQWGWIGQTDQTTFTDDNIDPDVSQAPRGDPIVDLTASGDRPGAVALFQQRLMYARSNNAPSVIWGSRTGNLLDFSISDPVRADDPIEAKPASGKADEIRHMVPFDGLLVFTAGAEWILKGSNGALATNNLEFGVQSYNGTSAVRPLVVGKSVIFLQRDGKIVRDFAYALQSDGYDGTDLRVLAEHVTAEYKITDWAYAQSPDSIVWAPREDGTLLGFTYLREHQVFAWTRHDTEGLFQSVASIAGTTESDVFFCVQRTIGGVAKYYIEKLATRDADGGVFMDSALSYSGAPVTTVSGLAHLEGKTVVALADGCVVRGLVVSGGAVTLPHSASVVHVGLSYVSDLETLDLDVSGSGDSNQGRRQKLSNLVLRLRDTRGVWAGPDSDHLLEVPFRTFEGYNEPTQQFTGDKPMSITPQWGRSTRVFVRQPYPLPVTVLAVIPELEVGG